METKRKIKLEVIIQGKKIFKATGKCDALYIDQNTKVRWNSQKPNFKRFGIELENSYKKLSEAYNMVFLATNAKLSNNLNHEIKTTIGRVRNDSK